MAKFQGRFGKFEVALDGVTFTEVAGIKDITMNAEASEITATTHDDGPYETYLAGRKNFSLDISALYDPQSAEQTAIIGTAFATDPSPILCRFRPRVQAGVMQATFSAIFTGCKIGTPNDDAATFDFTARPTAPPTWTAQV
jgi:predicted secreted protein